MYWSLGALSTVVGASGVPESAAAGVASPFSAVGCVTGVTPTSKWVWQAGEESPSCSMTPRDAGVYACADADGNVDDSSIYVDMTTISGDRTGCYVWTMGNCEFDINQMLYLDFDIDILNCGDVWAAPLWLTPHPWLGGGESGEIEMVECCPVGNVQTNFAGGGDERKWGDASGAGPKHFHMELVDGNIKAYVCDMDGSKCTLSGSYPNYLSIVNACADKTSCYPFSFQSDIWNGFGGDGGWSGCDAVNSPNTNCQFAVTNIKVTGADGKNVFEPSSNNCLVMNAAAYNYTAAQGLRV
jgi:hypothetical protein